MDDGQLLQNAGRGDLAAFRSLFDRYAPAMLRFTRRMIGDGAEVEDVVQEIMERLWTRAPLFDPARGKPRPWIYRLAGRVIANWRAARAVRQGRGQVSLQAVGEESVPAGGAGPEEVALHLDEAARVTAGLGRLPEDCREVLVLRHLEGLGIPEMAEILDCPEGTVKSRIFYALKKLRDVLTKEKVIGTDPAM